MLKLLKSYIAKIAFMSSLSSDERFLLMMMLFIMKKPIMYISVPTLVKWTGWGDKKVKKVRLSLERKGFLVVIKVEANNKKIYEISVDKLKESVVDHSTEVSEDWGQNGHIDYQSSGQNDTTTSVKMTPVSTNTSVKMTPHNIDNLNVDKNNIDDGLVVFDYRTKFKDNTVRDQQIVVMLECLKKDGKLKGECSMRAINDLLADVIYHVDNKKSGLTDISAINAVLKIMQKGEWTRPKGLREKLEEEAVAREKTAQAFKEQEKNDSRKLADLLSESSARSTKETASNWFAHMQSFLPSI